jgi:hypothetical protein
MTWFASWTKKRGKTTTRRAQLDPTKIHPMKAIQILRIFLAALPKSRMKQRKALVRFSINSKKLLISKSKPSARSLEKQNKKNWRKKPFNMQTKCFFKNLIKFTTKG